MSSFKRALALGAGTVLVLGLLGGYVKNRLWLAESTICLILGAVLGPMGLGWADLASLPLDPFALLKEAARLTLGISVMAAALRLPPGFVARRAAGLALLFVTLPALLVAQAPVEALSEWLTQVLLWQTIGSISIGLVLGWLAGHLLTWARRQPFCQHHSIATIALASSLTVLAFVRLIGSDGILAVFASGLVINSFVSKEEARQENVQAAVSRFFDLPVFILVGTMLPWAAWHELGWRAIGFAVAVLIVRRVPWWVALYRAVPEIRTMSEAVFLGWFGPIGISTIYDLLLIREKTGLHEVWEIGTIAVSLSVVAHGMSATPFTQLIGRARTTSGQAQQGS